MKEQIPIIINHFFYRETSKQEEMRKVPARKFSSLSFRVSGEVSIFATNKSFISTPGTLTFIPRGCFYQTEVLSDSDRYLLHFWQDEDSPPFCSEPLCITPKVSDSFVNLFEHALRHTQSTNPYVSMADAYRLLSEFYRICHDDASHPNTAMIACKHYLDEHISDPELRISHLAARYGCSEVYFRSEFRKCYHTSPMEYLKKRRLELACRLLQTQSYTVTEVATHAGFDSISYFSAEFRRQMGCSPSEYRTE
ncbi:MAG: helix-turn-helix transcriptional regulator [Ruminococcaceae bacterium]|nr:helix-turn-helix transcriptional regulator [Oscillospiraceae bacterium]